MSDSMLRVVDPLLLIEQPWLNPKAALDVCASQGCKPIYADPEYPIELFWNEHERDCSKGSLRPLALLFDKDERTIRRYCEAGVIPAKYTEKTKGGHWRIRYCDIHTIDYQKIELEIRKDRDAQPLVPRNWRNHVDPATEKEWFAHCHDLATLPNGSLLPEEVKTDDQRESLGVEKDRPTPEAIRSYSKDTSKLIAAAFYLRRHGKKPTAKAMASVLGISRATLYNSFSANQIKAVIKESGAKTNGGGAVVSGEAPSAVSDEYHISAKDVVCSLCGDNIRLYVGPKLIVCSACRD